MAIERYLIFQVAHYQTTKRDFICFLTRLAQFQKRMFVESKKTPLELHVVEPNHTMDVFMTLRMNTQLE